MKVMREERKRLIRLVKEKLDYEKMGWKEIRLEKVDYGLMEVFEMIKEEVGVEGEERENEVMVDVEDDVMVNGD